MKSPPIRRDPVENPAVAVNLMLRFLIRFSILISVSNVEHIGIRGDSSFLYGNDHQDDCSGDLRKEMLLQGQVECVRFCYCSHWVSSNCTVWGLWRLIIYGYGMIIIGGSISTSSCFRVLLTPRYKCLLYV